MADTGAIKDSTIIIIFNVGLKRIHTKENCLVMIVTHSSAPKVWCFAFSVYEGIRFGSARYIFSVSVYMVY